MDNFKEKYTFMINTDGSGGGSGKRILSGNQTFEVRIKFLREKLGLSQKDLAQKIGVDKNTIQRYEKGFFPKGETLIQLSEIFNCTIDYLLKGEDQDRISKDQADDKQSVEYDQCVEHDPYPAESDFKISEMITKTVEVLESNTPYKHALASNINIFHGALKYEIPDKTKKHGNTDSGATDGDVEDALGDFTIKKTGNG